MSSIARMYFTIGILAAFQLQDKTPLPASGRFGNGVFASRIRLERSNDQQRAIHRNGTIRFRVRLKPRQTWRATLQWIAQLEGVDQPFWGATADQRRQAFVDSSTEYRATLAVFFTFYIAPRLS